VNLGLPGVSIVKEEFTSDAEEYLRAAGFEGAVLVEKLEQTGDFGNGRATFRVGTMLLRILRDRGQEFLEVAWSSAPTRFYQYDDVEIAMGWMSASDVVNRNEPEALLGVLRRFRDRIDALQDAMRPEAEELTRLQLERAAHARGTAFLDRLRQG
jgi:hypothetical protein